MGSQVATISNGVYQISLMDRFFMSGPSSESGEPIRLFPPDGPAQLWQVQRTDNGTCTIRNVDTKLYVGFDGDPDPWEPARGYPEQRKWGLAEGEEPGTFTLAVPGAELRLAQSPLRIFPPFIALMPPGSPFDQAWTFRSAE
jgi:hypothetical protein